ncbi:AAA family ATPase [Isoptericola sp. S6320L]|uniref:ATP-binding protein n=1 Tax=Isoptericola sp. S6320L TaxID=2926411 RepID=UPI001FF69048|nr:LuxR family transcriptional regulator [Isoptericola sp. S6320L]MCK0115833.1 AAA family ATPase [Isoptericola sp. S6320L]
MRILGRRAEAAAVDRLLSDARAGRSAALVVRGEAGIGKTALLEHAGDVAAGWGFRVDRATAAESEMQFAFAGLHQLCATALERAGALPEPQRMALGVAFGQAAGPAPDRFLVGLAVLNLLAEVAEEQPLLCLMDDVQWLDEASAHVLGFVARRVGAEHLALVFAIRDDDGRDIPSPLIGLPELRLDGLAEPEARTLLASGVPAPLDENVRERIVAEARGNPLALLEPPGNGHSAWFAGGFERPDALDVPRRIEESFRRRAHGLPAHTQLLLLVAAAEPTGQATVLWHAASRLGIAREAVTPAQDAGLVEIDTQVRFRHPLVRSAVYQAARGDDRRRAHQALAEATDPDVDPDRRAWHRAQAVLGTDEDVAAELVRSASRAHARGGVAAAAALLEQAAALTPEPAVRAARALDAAQAKHEAGASQAATGLLAVAAAGPLDVLGRGRLKLLRAQVEFHTTRGSEGAGMLLDAARTLAPLDPELARDTYLQALEASFHAGRLGGDWTMAAVAGAARAAPVASSPTRPVDLLLDGLTTMFTHGYEASVPTLRRALDTLRGGVSVEGPGEGVGLDEGSRRRLWLACQVAATLWDDDAVYVLADLDARLAREAGALSRLPAALNALSSVLVLTGDLGRAAELVAEESAIRSATGAPPLPNARLILSAWQGRQAETTALHATMVAEATGRGEGATLGLADVAMAALHNGLGNYGEALAAASAPVERGELTFASIALPELVEAGVHAGEPGRADAALEQLRARAQASSTAWGLGLYARSRALLSTGPDAEEHYREAIDQLGRSRMATHVARAHLVYGEWLRREGRRQDAREQLRTAHEMLTGMGVDAFAARAARELGATGEHPRRRTEKPTDDLTAQELHVARLVATGATSREVAAQLFLSPRTVEAHLRAIFRKLAITSRRELRGLPLT